MDDVETPSSSKRDFRTGGNTASGVSRREFYRSASAKSLLPLPWQWPRTLPRKGAPRGRISFERHRFRRSSSTILRTHESELVFARCDYVDIPIELPGPRKSAFKKVRTSGS